MRCNLPTFEGESCIVNCRTQGYKFGKAFDAMLDGSSNKDSVTLTGKCPRMSAIKSTRDQCYITLYNIPTNLNS